MSIAKKFLHKVVKAQFNISSMVSGKFGKRLGDKDRAEGQRLKTALSALEKKLGMAMFGKGAADIDETSCSKLCDDAGQWHERGLQLVAASAATL